MALAAVADAGAAADPAQVAEVIVTAEKRSENIQTVPVSIEALDNRTLDRHAVNDFQDFVKLTPAINFQTEGPSQTTIYMRGIASGGVENGVGPLPSVGTYLDDQPITTVAGTLDIHIYDIARIEVLPGPQGTLYGASSEAGTMRIITNPPSTAGFSAGYDIEGNTVDHGSQGGVVEGFVNVPITDWAAVRLVAFGEHDAGYIDNVPGTRLFPTSGGVLTNPTLVKNDFNPVDTVGARAALKIDLNSNWSITPSVFTQAQRTKGIFAYQPDVGYLDTQRYQADARSDHFTQAALTINGKIGNYELVYTGSVFQRHVDLQSDYSDYSVFYDTLYGLGSLWPDSSGNPLKNPSEEIREIESFSKSSNEFRLISPSTDRLHFIVGLFEERQFHYYDDNFDIQGFPTALSIIGYPTSIYATDQARVDRDSAVFGEATFNVTSRISLTGGIRGYEYRNGLYGFFGYSAAYDALAGYSSGPGPTNGNCLTFTAYRNIQCVNINTVVSGTGETHKINATYKFDKDHLIYFTYSTGYRPGGVNQIGTYGQYGADTLTNYEVGWKTSWFNRRLVWNGAGYYEDWNKFQFAFPGPNGITVVENAPEGQVEGVESSVDYAATSHLTLSGGFVFTHAVLVGNFCGLDPVTRMLIPTCPDSSALALKGAPLPYTPDLKADLTARYTFQIGPWDGHAQAALSYKDTTPLGLRLVDISGLGAMPAYTNVDLAFGAEKNKTTMEVFVKNAFNAHGEIDRHAACSAVCYTHIPGVVGAVYYFPIQPLTVGVRFGQRF